MKKTSALTVLALAGAISMAAIPVSAADTSCGNINLYTLSGGNCITEDCGNLNDILSKCCDQTQLQNILSGNISSNQISDILNSCGIKLPGVNCPDGICTPSSDITQNTSNTGTDQSVPATTNTSESNNDQTEQNSTPKIPDSNTAEGISAYESKVIELVNEIRVQNGLNQLQADAELCRIARIKSQDMKDKEYFSHTSPTYGSPFDMMKQFGITYRTAGENIAMGQQTPEIVVNAWMNSEGHRANILNSSYTKIGVGYVADGNYWTQMFIG